MISPHAISACGLIILPCPSIYHGSLALTHPENGQKNDARMEVFGPAAPSIFASFLFVVFSLHWLCARLFLEVSRQISVALVEVLTVSLLLLCCPFISPILKRQLEIISPDVVVCGSSDVFETVRNIFEIKNKDCVTKPSVTIPNKLMRYMVVGKTVFVDFFHPAWYGKGDAELAAYAKEVFSWILQMRK